MAAIGDSELFEARMRHYVERLDLTPEGTLGLVAEQNPVTQVIAVVTLSWLVALGCGIALRRITTIRHDS